MSLPPVPGAVVIVGAAGFIGRWVARDACRRGWTVHAVVREAGPARVILDRWEARDAALHVADLSRDLAAAALVRRLRPAIIFNLAGYGVDRAERDAGLAERLNHHLVAELAGAIATPETRDTVLVHTGSALEYGTAGGTLSEHSAPSPTTLYGATKLRGTQALTRAAEQHGVRGVTARLFTVFGAGEHEGRLFPSLLAAARSGETLSLTEGLQRRDFAYVADVAALLLDLALTPFARGEVVNLASGTMHTVRDFVNETARQLRLPASRLAFGALPTRPEEMEHAGVAVARLAALTGRTASGDLPTSIERAVSDAARLG